MIDAAPQPPPVAGEGRGRGEGAVRSVLRDLELQAVRMKRQCKDGQDCPHAWGIEWAVQGIRAALTGDA